MSEKQSEGLANPAEEEVRKTLFWMLIEPVLDATAALIKNAKAILSISQSSDDTNLCEPYD